ncbi:MAG: hypothetical protein ACJ8F7_18620 [Gemmataceae bacterium]
MKRTAGAFTLLAALGGCMSTEHRSDTVEQFGQTGHAKEIAGAIGPWGQPVPVGANGLAAPANAATVSARGAMPTEGGVQQASYTSGVANAATGSAGVGHGAGGGHKGQIPQPPFAGPPGAVAAVGALPGGLPTMGMARSEVRFLGQDGMKVAWLAPTPTGVGFREQLEVPGRYNFIQGAVYRLKLSNIPKRAGLELYPTIEVVSQNPKTTTFLAHSAIPLTITDDDIEQVISGNFVVKVIYLPDPQFQDLATAGPDEVVSTRLDPGVDPVQEAQRRGSVLLIVRMGNIDLEAPNTPGMEAPNPYLRGPAMMPGAPMAPPPHSGRPPMNGPMTPVPSVTPAPPPASLRVGSAAPALPMPKPSGQVVLP